MIVVAAGQQVFGRKVGEAADGSPLDDVIGRNIDRRHWVAQYQIDFAFRIEAANGKKIFKDITKIIKSLA